MLTLRRNVIYIYIHNNIEFAEIFQPRIKLSFIQRFYEKSQQGKLLYIMMELYVTIISNNRVLLSDFYN